MNEAEKSRILDMFHYVKGYIPARIHDVETGNFTMHKLNIAIEMMEMEVKKL